MPAVVSEAASVPVRYWTLCAYVSTSCAAGMKLFGEQVTVPREHRQLGWAFGLLDQLIEAAPEAVIAVLRLHLRRGVIACRWRAAVAFGHDQTIFGVVGVFGGMAAGRRFPDAIAAHIVLVMRARVLLEQVAHHLRQVRVVELNLVGGDVPARIERLAVA